MRQMTRLADQLKPRPWLVNKRLVASPQQLLPPRTVCFFLVDWTATTSKTMGPTLLGPNINITQHWTRLPLTCSLMVTRRTQTEKKKRKAEACFCCSDRFILSVTSTELCYGCLLRRFLSLCLFYKYSSWWAAVGYTLPSLVMTRRRGGEANRGFRFDPSTSGSDFSTLTFPLGPSSSFFF